MERSTCGIVTHPLTDDQLHGCQNILLSYEFYRNPSNNLFVFFSIEEDYRTSSTFCQYINIVESRVTCAPLTIHCRYDLGIHDFDGSMANVFSGLDQDLVVDRLIRKVRFKRTRCGFATYIDNQHDGISADILASKWGNWNRQSKAYPSIYNPG